VTNLVPSRMPAVRELSFERARTFGSDIQDLLEGQRSDIVRLIAPKASRDNILQAAFGDLSQVVLGNRDTTSLHRAVTAKTFAEAIFNSLVELKVGVAQYAMHLSSNVRSKLFSDLDDVINVDDWYEGDTLPRAPSFRDFLKWTIYSKRFNWTSIGVSDEGDILVAWRSDNAMIAARYDGYGRVWWTATKEVAGEKNHAAGDSSLEFFEEDARRYLD
jgi:hypothetical protein